MVYEEFYGAPGAGGYWRKTGVFGDDRSVQWNWIDKTDKECEGKNELLTREFNKFHASGRQRFQQASLAEIEKAMNKLSEENGELVELFSLWNGELTAETKKISQAQFAFQVAVEKRLKDIERGKTKKAAAMTVTLTLMGLLGASTLAVGIIAGALNFTVFGGGTIILAIAETLAVFS